MNYHNAISSGKYADYLDGMLTEVSKANTKDEISKLKKELIESVNFYNQAIDIDSELYKGKTVKIEQKYTQLQNSIEGRLNEFEKNNNQQQQTKPQQAQQQQSPQQQQPGQQQPAQQQPAQQQPAQQQPGSQPSRPQPAQQQPAQQQPGSQPSRPQPAQQQPSPQTNPQPSRPQPSPQQPSQQQPNSMPQMSENIKGIIEKEIEISEKLLREYKEIEEKVDTTIDECLLGKDDMPGILSDEDIKNNDSYIEFYNQNGGVQTGTQINSDQKEEWLKTFKGEDGRKEKIRIATEYSRQGRDSWAKEVIIVAENRRRKMQEISIHVKKMKASVKTLFENFDDKMKTLETQINAEITTIKGAISTLDNKIDEQKEAYYLTAKDDSEKKKINSYISHLKKQKQNKEKELETKQNELKELDDKKKDKKLYEMEITTKINELESAIGEKVDRASNFENAPTNQQSQQVSPVQRTVNNGNVKSKSKLQKPTEIVKNKIIDLRDSAPSDIMEMIDGKTGYNELLNASREANLPQSRIIRRKMELRLDDLLKTTEFENGEYKIGGKVKLTKEQLYDLTTISEEKIKDLTDQIEKYAKEYDRTSGYNQKKLDKEMQILKLAVLLTETKIGISQRHKRFQNEHGIFEIGGRKAKQRENARLRVQDFGNELRKLAEKVENRANFQTSLKDKLFDQFNYTRDPKVEKKKFLDRSGKKPIQKSGHDER